MPNPAVERAEAKILLETLESILRNFDASALFYKRDVAPIFEVILPMTQTAGDINRIYHYYEPVALETAGIYMRLNCVILCCPWRHDTKALR